MISLFRFNVTSIENVTGIFEKAKVDKSLEVVSEILGNKKIINNRG